MLVKRTVLSFDASPSPDVVGYTLFLVEAPAVVDYDSPSFDLGNVTEIDIATLPGMATTDGVYNLGIAARDDAGNLSAMLVQADVPLDFEAPDAPANLRIIRE